jgi:ATP-dependent DNA ligase
MEAVQVDRLPTGLDWQFEPKWDGFRCLGIRDAKQVHLLSKSGKPLGRYFPDVVAMLAAVPVDNFVLDGELAIPIGGSLSFDALQLRLHPAASRVRKLAAETPAIFILFDALAVPGDPHLADKPLPERRAALEKVFAKLRGRSGLRLSPYTRRRAEAVKWLRAAGGGSLDGVIAKPLASPYRMGERVMLKVKCLRSADCVVGGFRYAGGGKVVGSLLLGLFNDEGLLDHVGFTSGLSAEVRRTLTPRLQTLRGGPGFTGGAPGGPSRWSTDRSAAWVPLKPKLVAEVRYDHVTGDRFRHGTRFLRWRPDKAPRQCTFDQLKQEGRPSKVIRDMRFGDDA